MSAGEATYRTRELKALLRLGGHTEHVEKVWTRTDRDDHPERPFGTVHKYRSVVQVVPGCRELMYAHLRDELAKLPNVERVTEARRHDSVASYDALIVRWRGWTEPGR